MVGESGAGAERSTAIVLFTDLVGSTELRSSLGEEAADGVRRQHDGLVTAAIEANRGRLVKNLGDGVMATFTGASDALAAAVAIQQALDRRNRSGANAGLLEVRIGVSAGDVVFEEADCFGTPVIEAARLCAAAEGGQILVTEVVRWLVGTGCGYELRPVRPLDLKGLPEPVPACDVAWEPLPAAEVPLPSLLTGTGRIFVGRDGELERFLALWKEVSSGDRWVALLAGEPGIGKTRLAAELAAQVHEEGATVLAGRCDEDLGVPYQPFVEALRHYVAHASEPRLGRHAGELTRLVPELDERVAGLAPPLRSDPETERYRLFDAVAAWLNAASTEQPILLVVDDLQWAAKPTLLLLRHVLRSPEAMRLLVVVTYRDSDIGRGHPLRDFLADLRRDGATERFPLSGLDRAAVGAYIEAAAGHALPEEDQPFISTVWAETDGNPFFVAEVLRHLFEAGAIEQRAGRWVTTAPVEELGIPEGVRDVVGRRLSRLGEGTDRVLAVASVVGLEFEAEVVRSAAGLGEDEVLLALEEATSARLLIEISGPVVRYRFGHALVRATLYDELSGARRVTLHRRVAEAIEAVHADGLDDHLPALAHHWARASAPAADVARAIDYTSRAGHRALAQLAHDEAVAYYRQALELLDAAVGHSDGAQRLRLLVSLGEAQRRAGDPTHRETLLAAAGLAQEQQDANTLAGAALANHRGVYSSAIGKVDEERIAVLEAALGALDDGESPTRARLLAALGQELSYSGDREQRVSVSDEALEMARRLNDPATLAQVLLERFFAIAAPESLPERLMNTAELVTLAEGLGDPVTTCRAWMLRARAAMEAGDPQEFDHCLETAEALSTDLGQPTLRWFVSLNRAVRTLFGGDIEEAERLAHVALELGQATGQPDAPMLFAGQLFFLRFEQGRLHELEDKLAEAAALNPGIPAFQAILALLYCELDRPEAARPVFERLAADDFAAVPHDTVWTTAMVNCAAVCAHLEDQPQAAVLFEKLSPYASHLAVTVGGISGSLAQYLGMLATTLARWDDAEEHFAAASATYGRIPAPNWLARTRLERARMLLRRARPGDAERARDLLGQALATARELGLANVERRAVALLT